MPERGGGGGCPPKNSLKEGLSVYQPPENPPTPGGNWGAGEVVSQPWAPVTPSWGGLVSPSPPHLSLCGDSGRARGNQSLRHHKCLRLCGQRKGSVRKQRGGGGRWGGGHGGEMGDKQGPIHSSGGGEGTVTVHVPQRGCGETEAAGGDRAAVLGGLGGGSGVSSLDVCDTERLNSLGHVPCPCPCCSPLLRASVSPFESALSPHPLRRRLWGGGGGGAAAHPVPPPPHPPPASP